MSEYWFNVRTGEVEQGAQSSWKHLLGPYSSYAEAARAMERVQENNEAWEADDDAPDSDSRS
ncbi:SPOR domain-containing protein [Nesterenkonia sp.]|uniref:SPOR domain-containing protein n=1 Tax=Nesterenkonia sp. TaxID=704201 RepID=UPI00261D23C7|nr:SPOR domain-containing protein [Nesterenkonia sp.]